MEPFMNSRRLSRLSISNGAPRNNCIEDALSKKLPQETHYSALRSTTCSELEFFGLHFKESVVSISFVLMYLHNSFKILFVFHFWSFVQNEG